MPRRESLPRAFPCLGDVKTCVWLTRKLAPLVGCQPILWSLTKTSTRIAHIQDSGHWTTCTQ